MRAQRVKLAVLWLTLSGFIFALMLAQTLSGRYDGNALEPVWKWFFPLVLPTLTLILQRFVAEEKRGLTHKPPGSVFLFRTCIILSAIYLLLPLMQILSIPFRAPEAPLQWLEKSLIWIMPFQTLPFVVLAVFFHKKNDKQNA